MEQNKDINQFDIQLAKRIYLKDPNSIFFINRNAKIEKKRQRTGENIKIFFNNIVFELFKWILLARGISN